MNTTIKTKSVLAQAEAKIKAAEKAFDEAWNELQKNPSVENRAAVNAAHKAAMEAHKVYKSLERNETSRQFKKAGF